MLELSATVGTAVASAAASTTGASLRERLSPRARMSTLAQSGVVSWQGASRSSSAATTVAASYICSHLLERPPNVGVGGRECGADGPDLDSQRVGDRPVVQVRVVAQEHDESLPFR